MEDLDLKSKDINVDKLIKAREKGIVGTSVVGISGNVVLVAIKAVIGFLAGSVAIIMDALNNLTDALSSIITIIGTRIILKTVNLFGKFILTLQPPFVIVYRHFL